ncbi:MAG: tRNA glutamyl-Q(34) synthetase GluQRS [Eggerthellaceae bacterium]|nr:tRNA glutamyl-Q(34) synthetase GluQRS [Eggerthellaceae bacterium]
MGNIYAFLVAYIYAKKNNGEVLLRIDDLDKARSKQFFIDYIQYDLDWLGIQWDRGPYFQSERAQAYAQAFQKLSQSGDVYPCFCSRATLAANAPHEGEYSTYPGTCLHLSNEERRVASLMKQPSYRLHVHHSSFEIDDIFQGHHIFTSDKDAGDFVLQRADGVFAYQLASVVDDEAFGITHVIRGYDLLQSVPMQGYLIEKLKYHRQQYGHVPLIRNGAHERLSKRAGAPDMQYLQDIYSTPEALLGNIAYQTHLVTKDNPISIEELVECADLFSCYTNSHVIL